ncbi:7-carboxy-7-deazaguanine synthase QueE [Syntrophomonas palmitatica]|uniref:7-carboxy-7-deazaguanine synthase QueE n=1 Tax=Syntrophomonas palmitatica TaxID=402877 RepID=UPI0006CF3F4E|nr:7-carboxy-7-deazaguanine synthase QueE [Syntrophomonas palmitatica]
MMYPVVEIFGPTIQGEGVNMGQRTMFVRLAGCDYRCKWCDTAYALEDTDVIYFSPQNILKKLKTLSAYCTTVTLTGGNPCIHDLQPLITVLRDAGYEIHVETQGSIWQDCLGMADMINLSPKPPSSGMADGKLVLDRFVEGAAKMHFKVVVLTLADYQYARELHLRYPEIPMVLQVGCEPDYDTADKLLSKYRALVEMAANDSGISDNLRVLPQMHVLAWGNKPGV